MNNYLKNFWEVRSKAWKPCFNYFKN